MMPTIARKPAGMLFQEDIFKELLAYLKQNHKARKGPTHEIMVSQHGKCHWCEVILRAEEINRRSYGRPNVCAASRQSDLQEVPRCEKAGRLSVSGDGGIAVQGVSAGGSSQVLQDE